MIIEIFELIILIFGVYLWKDEKRENKPHRFVTMFFIVIPTLFFLFLGLNYIQESKTTYYSNIASMECMARGYDTTNERYPHVVFDGNYPLGNDSTCIDMEITCFTHPSEEVHKFHICSTLK